MAHVAPYKDQFYDNLEALSAAVRDLHAPGVPPTSPPSLPVTGSEFLLDFATLRDGMVVQQFADGCGALVLWRLPNVTTAAPLVFHVQTNSCGLLVVNNPGYTGITYTGALWLAPNTVHTLTWSNINGVQTVTCSTPAPPVHTNVVLAWLTYFGAALANNSQGPPKNAHWMAGVALALYQSVVSFPALFDVAVANEAGAAAMQYYLPAVAIAPVYDNFPKLAAPGPVQAYVLNLLSVMLAYGPTADSPVYAGPPPATPPPYLWTGTNPVLPNWGTTYVPYLANTYATLPPDPVPTIPADAAELHIIQVNRTEAQRQIAVFFSADPTVQLMTMFAALVGDGAPLMSVLALAQLAALAAIALADAGTLAWQTKYTYWSQRPSLYDPSLVPIIPLPSFPSYTSGHSTFSAAWAAMLSLRRTDLTPCVDFIAQECGLSRLYGMVHFRADDTQGIVSGNAVGVSVHDALLGAIQANALFV